MAIATASFLVLCVQLKHGPKSAGDYFLGGCGYVYEMPCVFNYNFVNIYILYCYSVPDSLLIISQSITLLMFLIWYLTYYIPSQDIYVYNKVLVYKSLCVLFLPLWIYG